MRAARPHRLLATALLALGLLAPPGLASAGSGGRLPLQEPPRPRRQAVVSLEDFHAALDPLGTWFVHPRWGQVWKPTGVSNLWRPYTRGRWARTDGTWYWVSEEPWAWATYHFGRWFLDPLTGWLWAPGKRWAPAWVQWREGKGIAGWAPLGPDGKALAMHYTFVPAGKLEEPADEVALPAPRTGEALRDTRPVGAQAQASR